MSDAREDPELSRDLKLRYQPCYCEENIWWLCKEPRFESLPCWVLIISNADHRVAFWQQRATSEGTPILWDYHVVLLVGSEPVEVWDFDSRLDRPVPLDAYLAQTFLPLPALANALSPHFRLLSADAYLATLCTDRSHMRDAAGNYRHAPPPWPPPMAPQQKPNLSRLLDMGDAIAGQVFDLQGLRQRFESG